MITSIIKNPFFSLLQRYVAIILLFKGDEYLVNSSCKNESLFRHIINTYNDTIDKICFAYANSIDEYQDLRQDSLINIWQGIDSFKGEAGLRTWIYRVTLNTCVSTLRKNKRHKSNIPLSSLYDLIDDDNDRKLMIAELHDIISCLSPPDKAIILLWLDEFSYDEMANLTGLSRNTLAARLRRAKIKLQILSHK